MRFDRRLRQDEWMDDPALDPADLARCLADLATVNTVTLARPPTLAFLRRVARGRVGRAPLSVLDVGSGHGDMLRRIARWGVRAGVALRLEGIDLNPASAIAARAATPPELGIAYRSGDVFDEPSGSVDVVISSLVAHHMDDAAVVQFLGWMERTARHGWFVNDLHRHPLAYHGFAALSRLASWHPIVRHDGPVSVARSFVRRDWERLLGQAGLDRVARISWRVPFRYCVARCRS